MILEEPYIAPYSELLAVSSETADRIEYMEKTDCLGGMKWSVRQYAQSPLVRIARIVGGTARYLLKTGNIELPLKGSEFPAGICGAEVKDNEITISFAGLGGGGVGVAGCRTKADGILSAEYSECGGGKTGRATIHLPKRERVIIGIDDTDTPEAGATWSLAHRIGKAVETNQSRYISHTIVQLFPVKQRTKNCVATALEFATSEPDKLISQVKELVETYTLSDKTGMAVFRGFDPSPLLSYGWMVKKGEVTTDALNEIRKYIETPINGSGIIGAAAAIPFATKYREALELCGRP